MSGISLDEIVLTTGSGATDSDTLRVELSTESLAALENITVTIDNIDVDIRDLVFATDKVDVTGSEVSLDAATLAALETITVTATDLDIRNLVFATDKVDVSGSTVNTTPTGSDTILNSAATVTTTAAEVIATPLTGRVAVIIQNEGNQPVYVGSSAGVTTATGTKISKNSSMTLDVSDVANIFMIAGTGSQDVRFLEIAA